MPVTGQAQSFKLAVPQAAFACLRSSPALFSSLTYGFLDNPRVLRRRFTASTEYQSHSSQSKAPKLLICGLCLHDFHEFRLGSFPAVPCLYCPPWTVLLYSHTLSVLDRSRAVHRQPGNGPMAHTTFQRRLATHPKPMHACVVVRPPSF